MRHYLTQLVDQVVRQVVRDITHSPGGYQYWQQLPSKGYYSAELIQRRLHRKVKQVLLPKQAQIAMVQAALSTEGVPDSRGRALYQYLLQTVYQGREQALYKDWLQVQQVGQLTSTINNDSSNR